MRLPTRKPGKYSQIKTDNLITEAKFNELKSKLDHLQNVSRPQMMKEVARLAEMGDFSENFGYQAAKGRLRGINNAILKLEFQINHAEIIKLKRTDVVQIGSTVTVESNGKKIVFQILGSQETDPAKGIISHSSPIGTALIGHRIDDVVSVTLKDREIVYKILKIT